MPALVRRLSESPTRPLHEAPYGIEKSTFFWRSGLM